MAPAVFILAATLVSVSPGGSPAVAAPRNTPPGKVLILSDNLYEADVRDSRHSADMRRFVDRSLEFSPYVPDVLLLQEVRARAVENVRSFFTKRTGQRFVTVVNAGRGPWKKLSEHRLLGADTAIVINSATMRLAGDKGRIRHSYKLRYSKAGSPVKVKLTSYALVEERGPASDPKLRLPVASLHYPKQREFTSEHASQVIKAGFSKQIAEKLKTKWPGSEYKRTIAGDFNNFRCMSDGGYGTGGSLNCDQTPAYDALTKRYGYKDSVFLLNGNLNPIDYIFTTGNVVNAKFDRYATTKPSNNNFYSNHQLRWALVEGPDTTPPTSPGKVRHYGGFSSFVQVGYWEVSRDGGSGFRRYEIWRAEGLNSDNYSMVGTAQDNGVMFKDYDIQKGQWYKYQVRAVDYAGNWSGTGIMEIRAG